MTSRNQDLTTMTSNQLYTIGFMLSRENLDSLYDSGNLAQIKLVTERRNAVKAELAKRTK